MGEHAGRHAEIISERLVAELAALRGLPAIPLEPCEKRAARVSSMALVRYRTDDHSVPTAYGFQDVIVKAFVDEVVMLCAGAEIARYPRCYGEGVFVSNPLHYLALIETKPNALDQAAALQGWNLPKVFQHLRHLLEARMGNRGKREFIQVLRLLEALPLDIVTGAVTHAIQIGAIGFEPYRTADMMLNSLPMSMARASPSPGTYVGKLGANNHRVAGIGVRLSGARAASVNNAPRPTCASLFSPSLGLFSWLRAACHGSLAYEWRHSSNYD